MKSQNITRIVIGASIVLLVPLIAMLFTDEVQWGLFDFLIIGTLLIGAGVAYEFVTSKVDPKHRGALAVVFVAAVLLIWAELAVGVFGSPFAGS
jgi:hypothetical protein